MSRTVAPNVARFGGAFLSTEPDPRHSHTMPVSDLNIHRSAHFWIRKHGEQATAKVREMVEKMQRKGDAEGADTWLRDHRGDRHAGRAADRFAALTMPGSGAIAFGELAGKLERLRLECAHAGVCGLEATLTEWREHS